MSLERTPVIVVDGANVVGSRPDGWWRDRPGAAARLREQLVAARAGELGAVEVWLVLEGAARAGVEPGETDGVRTVHAAGEGDDAIVAEARQGVEHGHRVRVVTADRGLQSRVTAAGAEVLGPSWLLDRL